MHIVSNYVSEDNAREAEGQAGSRSQGLLGVREVIISSNLFSPEASASDALDSCGLLFCDAHFTFLRTEIRGLTEIFGLNTSSTNRVLSLTNRKAEYIM